MEVRAPAVIKLLGEHAVVYGKMSLAVAISLYASAKVSEGKANVFALELNDFKKSFEFSAGEIRKIHADYAGRKSINSYVDEHSGRYGDALPYLTIASRLLVEYNARIMGSKVAIESAIPVQKGLASSAACSTAFAVALLSHSGIRPSDADIIEIARDGDRVIHKNEGAGRIDVNTSFYGGFVSFSSETGARREELSATPDLLLIDTGPKKSTAETVGHVSELYKNDRSNTERLLEGIDMCSRNGMAALAKGDMAAFGKCMLEDHELLRKLGVSSERLDKVVEYAKEAKAYGAKLSGGGGGGLAIAVDNDSSSLESMLKSKDFGVSKATVSTIGASSYLTGAAETSARGAMQEG
jgi:mevalonate kinase